MMSAAEEELYLERERANRKWHEWQQSRHEGHSEPEDDVFGRKTNIDVNYVQKTHTVPVRRVK